jgi:superfamily II DNA or RNA helicase
MMEISQKNYPVGARVIIRDEEWRITEVTETTRAGFQLKVTGLSDLVRGKFAVFYTRYEGEENIEILRPEETRLVEDTSPGFIRSKLYLEALYRTAPKTDPDRIAIADKAAMDPLPYQFNPALQALSQPRARILIADAVGIGKTLEAGILTSELIARGRGRRILVLATKAMLSQFQQEFWNRFSIPLVRLDSEGIKRVRNRLPPYHNPFHYFDRSIISIDTLKQDSDYRIYLEKAYWDIIIIDEAHNVAVRSSQSQRARLAQLLASRSDTMILLSATPHDGKPESFASLLNILDPTAIPNPSKYTVNDFADKGLVIRRFKKDIADQVTKTFPERQISTVEVKASTKEAAVFDYLDGLTFSTLDHHERTGARLFATTLIKSFFSSPAACLAVIEHRLAKLQERKGDDGASDDIRKLRELQNLVKAVKPADFSKLGRLVAMMRDGDGSIGWNPDNPKDRLVIFTESIATLKFLASELPGRTGLKASQILELSGQLQDTEIAARVNAFNRGDSPAKVLLCSDIASEGINLHHYSHRLIHFDIPWALMTFQQRNGRIDRYGQIEQPQIWYMQTIADKGQAKGDARVLQKLVEKDKKVQENLSDPAEFLSAEEQEDRTAAECEGHLDPDDAGFSLDALFGGNDGGDQESLSKLAPVLSKRELASRVSKSSLLFSGDMAFARAALRELNSERRYGNKLIHFPDSHSIYVSSDLPGLRERLSYLPSEILPKEREFELTDDKEEIESEMQRARAAGDEWPKVTWLWALHPVMLWLEDRLLSSFGRHAAPVLRLPSIKNGEVWALLQGGYPNRRGYIPIYRWTAVRMAGGQAEKKTLSELVQALSLPSQLSNPTGTAADQKALQSKLRPFVEAAIAIAREDLKEARSEFNAGTKAKLDARLADLARLHEEHLKVLQEHYSDALTGAAQARMNDRKRLIDRNFEDARRYIRETAETEDEAYLQLAALFVPTGF